MLVMTIPTFDEAVGDSSSAEAGPYPLGLLLSLGFKDFDGGEIAGADAVPGRQAQDERGAAGRTEIDEENLGDLRGAAQDAADHALPEAGVEAAVEQDEIGNARRLHRYHGDRRRRRRRDHGKQMAEGQGQAHRSLAAGDGGGNLDGNGHLLWAIKDAGAKRRR